MPILLGGMLAWNLLTDWVWIGSALHFLPSNYQKDLQNRARNIIDTMNAAKSIIITAQKDKRRLTSAETILIRQNADAAEQAINDMDTFYTAKFVAYGASEAVKGLKDTISTMKLQLADFRATAGITTRAALGAAKIETYVRAVHDGDTITLENDEVVRLVGIDAPESTTTAGQASKKFLISLILGKRVTVESDPAHMKDIYGRRLAVVFLGSININIEMLKNAYAVFYPYEPNALVYDKVWKAAAEEAKDVKITTVLADLKEMRNLSYEKLRLWKSDEKAAQKAIIDEEKERYKSEKYENLEELRDEYALIKDANKEDHRAIFAAITDEYKAKTITKEEKAAKRAVEIKRYREVRKKASADYREAKKGIRDPYTAEKNALSAQLRAIYKEIYAAYAAKRKEIYEEYKANVKAVKERLALPYATEPEMPPSISPPIYVPPELPVGAPPIVAPPGVAPAAVAPPAVAPPVVAPPEVPVKIPEPVPSPPPAVGPPYIFEGVEYKIMKTRYFVQAEPGSGMFDLFVGPSPNVPYGYREINQQEALSLAQQEIEFCKVEHGTKGRAGYFPVQPNLQARYEEIAKRIQSTPGEPYFASIPGLGTFVPLSTANEYFWYRKLEKEGKIKNIGTTAAPLWVTV